jgi:outer membrane receptor protein involved in Fe transport
MHNYSKLAKSIRLAVLLGAASTTLLTVNTANAAEEAKAVEKIAVTGSRINRTDAETSVPVTTITRADFLEIGALNVADVLNASPVSITSLGQSNNTFAGSSVGLQTTQLRGLDSARTLVLVNGRRFVSGLSPSVGYAVDLNAIPTSMIERIEILKSASSAVYGSDAVAGVVNIITRTEFDGVELTAQSGTSAESDREKFSVSLTTGGSWNTGSATFSAGFDDDKGLNSSDRPFSAFDQAIFLDDNGNEEIGTLNSSYPPGARVGGYNGDGTPYSGASNSFNRAAYRQLVTPLERKYVAFTIHQDITEKVRYFGEFNFNSSETNNSTIEPTPLDVVNGIWFKDRNGKGGMSIYSPLVPDLLRDNLEADGKTNLNQTSFVRRMVEFGARSTDVQRSTVRIAQGFDWNIDDNWGLNTYMTWGRTDQTQDNGGQINVERAALALDVEIDPVNGGLRCVSEGARVQGCVPLNLFIAGGVTPAAVDYVRSPAKTRGQVEQFVIASSLTGDLPIDLAGGAIATAFGIEHRLEKGSYDPADLAQTGASSTNKSESTDGSFTSDDVFIEFMLPVLDNLTFDLAARYSDHQIVGGQTTYNLGIEYSPLDSVKLRASAATAVRTPNIADLFGGRGETFANVSDPCNGLQADGSGDVVGDIRANCLSISSIADRVNATGEFKLSQPEVQGTGGTVGGNPLVREETADTLSLGIVWQAMEGLEVTLDYYDIAVKDAIDTTSRTTVLSRCYDVSPGSFSANCNGATTRDSNGALTEVHSGTSNENNIDTSGFDIEINYRVDMGPGVFTTNLLWNHTKDFVRTSIEDGSSVDYAGEVLNPSDRANLNFGYTIDDLSVSWRMRYWDASVDSVESNNLNFTDGEPLRLDQYGSFPSVLYHDISTTYHLTDKISGTIGIRNLFDKQPPVANQSSNSGSTGINTVPEAYDVTGRYFNASVSVKF